MKLSHLWGLLGAVILVACFVAYAKNAAGRDDLRDRIKACQQIGIVADDCPKLVPSIERCNEEDCGDIDGYQGYFCHQGVCRLQEAPETVIRPQGLGS